MTDCTLRGVLALCSIAVAHLAFCVFRHFSCRGSSPSSVPRPASAMVVFGSGGHTSEMLHLIRDVSLTQLSPLCFVTAHSDETSLQKIRAFQLKYIDSVQWSTIYRSREVKQSWLSTVVTTSYALLQSFHLVLVLRPQVILCNGPGTCVPICLAAALFRFFSAQFYSPRIVFTESYCRVESLSLTGKILYNIADKFIVQWPQLLQRYPKARYIGKVC
mmetsp:Transcript_7585/g.12767  ORF Transcript_7585/g.12767 Transcript_7585/m.12767 type:complete len:217 (-) Transcript_7585:347-997(-)